MEQTSQNKKNIGIAVLLIFIILLGVTMFAFGVRGVLVRYHQAQYYQTARGVIREVNVHKGENGKTYSAEYYYEVDGKGYTIKDKVSTSNEPQVGHTVEVHYDPDIPENAYVEGKMTPYGVLILMGILFTCVPLAIFMAEYAVLSVRVENAVNGLLFGFAFSGLGFGLLYGIKPDGILESIFLFLFGCLGLYMLGYTVYRMIAGK